MSTEQNKALVQRFYQALDANNGAAMTEIVAPDWVNIDPSLPPLRGVEGAQQLVRLLKSAFPDYKTTIESIIAEGNRVAAHLTHTASHRGDFNGIPATGKQATISASAIFTLQNGKLTENRVIFDAMGLLRQLGVIPV